MKTRIWVHQRMECLWFLDPEDNPRLIRSSFSIDGHESLLTRIFIGGRPVSLASWAKIRSQSVAFAAAPMKIDGMAMNIQAKPAQTDWIRALLALLAERTRWKYACHGRPPKINIMKLSTHRGASKNILKDRFEMTSFKGSSDQNHFNFEINVGTRRIRQKTTLNLNFQSFWVDLEIRYSIS